MNCGSLSAHFRSILRPKDLYIPFITKLASYQDAVLLLDAMLQVNWATVCTNFLVTISLYDTSTELVLV